MKIPERHRDKVHYVWSVFSSIYDLPEIIQHDFRSNQLKIQLNTSGLVFFEKRAPLPDIIVWKEWKGQQIPFLFVDSEEQEILTTSRVHDDILSSAFYFLSGWQEYHSKKRDRFGRYPYQESFQFRHNTAKLPLVNYYFDILKTALEKSYSTPINFRSKEPQSVFLSHDIDKCETAWIEGGYHLLKKRKIRPIVRLILQKLSGKDAWFNLDDILSEEAKIGGKSTFYFLASRDTVENVKNADYSVETKKYREIQQKIVAAGSEVGIHGSYGTSSNATQLQREISRMEVEIVGNRFHYLHFLPGESLPVLEQSNVLYDSSLGFAEQVGFRHGICHPFHLYDLEYNCQSKIVEIPLMVMDTTLFQANYLNVKPEEAQQLIVELLEEVAQFHGVFSILWHNNAYSDIKFGEWKKGYHLFVEALLKREICFKTGSELASEYSQRLNSES